MFNFCDIILLIVIHDDLSDDDLTPLPSHSSHCMRLSLPFLHFTRKLYVECYRHRIHYIMKGVYKHVHSLVMY